MAKRDRAVRAKPEKKRRPSAKPAAVEELEEELTGETALPAGPAIAGGPIQAQAAQAFRRARTAPGTALRGADILALQSIVGNRAVQRMLAERKEQRAGRAGVLRGGMQANDPSTRGLGFGLEEEETPTLVSGDGSGQARKTRRAALPPSVLAEVPASSPQLAAGAVLRISRAPKTWLQLQRARRRRLTGRRANRMFRAMLRELRIGKDVNVTISNYRYNWRQIWKKHWNKIPFSHENKPFCNELADRTNKVYVAYQRAQRSLKRQEAIMSFGHWLHNTRAGSEYRTLSKKLIIEGYEIRVWGTVRRHGNEYWVRHPKSDWPVRTLSFRVKPPRGSPSAADSRKIVEHLREEIDKGIKKGPPYHRGLTKAGVRSRMAAIVRKYKGVGFLYRNIMEQAKRVSYRIIDTWNTQTGKWKPSNGIEWYVYRALTVDENTTYDDVLALCRGGEKRAWQTAAYRWGLAFFGVPVKEFQQHLETKAREARRRRTK